MLVSPIKTHKITSEDKDIFKILNKYLGHSRGGENLKSIQSTDPRIHEDDNKNEGQTKKLILKENTILAITSKIIAIAQGRMVPIDSVNKDSLIEQESQYYLPRNENPYQVSLTITNNTLVATAGIDESNANGYYILWPENPQKVANEIRKYVREKFNLKNLGIIITDSKTSPLRWGVTAIAIAYSGIAPTKNYIGEPDLFGRKFEYEQMSIIDNLASAAAVVMGEGAEQMPIAVIEDIPFVQFRDADPSQKELDSLHISIEEDLYSPLLKSVQWKKGEK